MHIVKLLHAAADKLDEGDLIFNERVETTLAILRCKGCVPFLRSKLNGHLHRMFAASIVLAFDIDETLDLHTRRAGDLHWQGISTCLPKYLDQCVKSGLLKSDHPKAKGKMLIGHLLSAYLSDRPAVHTC